jgi:hypothetical protein
MPLTANHARPTTNPQVTGLPAFGEAAEIGGALTKR